MNSSSKPLRDPGCTTGEVVCALDFFDLVKAAMVQGFNVFSSVFGRNVLGDFETEHCLVGRRDDTGVCGGDGCRTVSERDLLGRVSPELRGVVGKKFLICLPEFLWTLAFGGEISP